MKPLILLLLCALLPGLAVAQGGKAATTVSTNVPAGSDNKAYVLRGGDTVLVSVYQEDDMGTRARVEKDGTILMPLLGKVNIGGKTLEAASNSVRDLLGKNFLVNPQVSITVTEFVRRRFAVLGQVKNPGTYELPTEESLNLLQAIAMAGGYTRIGAPRKVTLQRVTDAGTKTYKLDAEAMSNDKDVKPFEIQAEDTVIVGEKVI